MHDIKTKEIIKGTIKHLDKSAVAADRMRTAYIQTKEKAEHSMNPSESNPEEYASDKMSNGINKTSQSSLRVVSAGKRVLNNHKNTVSGAQTRQNRRVRTASKLKSPNKSSSKIRTLEKSERYIKQVVSVFDRETIKTVERNAISRTSRGIKTAENTAKMNIKTTAQAVAKAKKSIRQSAKAAKKSAKSAKASEEALSRVIRGIISAAKSFISLITGSGVVAVVIIIIVCVVAAIVSSIFGIFFASEDTGSDATMRSVIQEIDNEYNEKISSIKSSNTYDEFALEGGKAPWKEVLAVYSVKVNTAPDNPQEIVTMDDEKKKILSEVFWDMNSLSSRTETVSKSDSTDDDGSKDVKYLYITVSHKTAEEMADEYKFNDTQREYLTGLLSDEYASMWSAVLYGISYNGDNIVEVAVAQLGNVGGEPYWSWYGFSSRVEWCACFVSWCANECGYIESGTMPKYALVDDGVNWFKSKGEWLDGSEEPEPGMVIFFDWSYDGIDGSGDHTGIVEKVENGIVYTIEGNSSDTCKENYYPVGYYEILGYGVPEY